MSDNNDGLGPLAGLLGSWTGSKGWNIIAVPSAGSEPDQEGAFELLVRPYTETITFSPVGDLVRNRGGAVDQFIGAVQYEMKVADLETNEALHVENGMWLYLDNIKPESPEDKPKFSIARSATIPHGDSAMILGNSSQSKGAPTIPDISSEPPDIGAPKVLGYLDPYGTQVPGLISVSNPNANLKEDIAKQTILETTTLSLDSANQGGVTNIPFINRFADATRFQCDYWIETVETEDNKTIQQLQYSQIVDLEFHKKFGKEGLIIWPHVNINTLRKQ